MPAQHRHAPGIAAPSVVYDTAATGAGLTPASFDAGQSTVPCAMHGTRASPNGGDGPAPCDHGNCPSCPCPCCCPLTHAAIGVLLQETERITYAQLLSAIITPPACLGSLARFAVFAGQPRAPPILI